MNKIYKVIWSRCSNTFVVVSELAASRRTGRSATTVGSVSNSPRSFPFSALAAGALLACGLSASALAQTASVPGGSVDEIHPGDAAWTAGTDASNTAYGNALKINAEAGPVFINGGTFSILPVAPHETRPAADSDPYAAIWLEQSTSADDNRVYLADSPLPGGSVNIEVAGDNLHGIYTESSSSLRSMYSTINAVGDDVSGITAFGQLQLSGGQITAEGKNAIGVHAGSTGSFYVDGGARVQAEGENAVGIRSGGWISVNHAGFAGKVLEVDVRGQAGSNATGMLIYGGQQVSDIDNISVAVTGHADGARATGILLEDLSSSDRSIIFKNTDVTVVGSDNGAYAVGIDVGENLTLNLTQGSVDVKSHNANGVFLRENAKATLDGITVSALSNGTGAGSMAGVLADDGASLTIQDSSISTESKEAAGVAIRDGGSASISNTDIVVNVGAVDPHTYSRGISASGASTLNVADSTIEVGTIDDSNSVGVAVDGLQTARGTLAIDSSKLTVHGVGGTGLFSRHSDFTLTGDTRITTNGVSNEGLWMQHSNANIDGATIITQGASSSGLVMQSAAAEIRDTTFHMNGANSRGWSLGGGTEVQATDTEIVMQGADSVGAMLEDDARLNMDGGAITSTGTRSIGVDASGASYAVLAGTAIEMQGQTNVGIKAEGSDTGVWLEQATLDITGYGAQGVVAESQANIDIAGGRITISGNQGRALQASRKARIITDDVEISATKSNAGGVIYGLDTNEGRASLHNTRIDVEDTGGGASSAYGLSLANASQVDVAGGSRIRVSSNAAAHGVTAFESEVTLEDTHLEVSGESRAFGLDASESQVTLHNTKIDVASVTGDAHGISLDDSAATISATPNNPDARIMAASNDGYGFGISAHDGSDFNLSGYRIEVKGKDGADGAYLIDSKGQISDAHIQTSSTGESAGLSVYFDAELTVERTTVEAISDAGTALGAVVVNGELTLSGSNITAQGAQAAAISAVGGGGEVNIRTSAQTRLTSSGRGLNMVSFGTDTMEASFTDTEIIAGAETLASQFSGDGTQIFNLGAGTVATANNGVLLKVERDPGAPEMGRVELNLADGAAVSGAISDADASLAALSADGGTHLSLRNAEYAGTVQNVRAINLSNGARIGGGTAATRNTVLENVLVDNANFSGNWRVGGVLTAQNGGRIAPGNSIGVISTAAINWGPGTIYEVEVNGAGASDLVEVTGPAAADISQTALEVREENGTGGYRLDHDYTILTAAGGVSGQFIQADWMGNGLINVTPIYAANQVSLSLSVRQQALGSAGFTVNQRATADGALSLAGLNVAVDAAFLSNDPAASFDSLSGEIHPSTRAGLMHSSAMMSGAILKRLRDEAPGSYMPTAEKNSEPASVRHPLWVSYGHDEHTAKGNANTARRKHSIDTLSVGGDSTLESGWTIGGALTYASGKVRLNTRQSESSIDSYGLAAYAGNSWTLQSGSLNFKGGLGHIWHDIDTRRDVTLGGGQTLKAGYDARSTQLFADLGYAMPTGDRSQVEPYLGLAWLQHRSDSFAETGGPAALKGSSSTDDVTFSTVGMRASTAFASGNTSWKLHGGVGWRHAFGDRDPGAQLSFIESSGPAFTITGAPLARNAAVFNLGAEVQVARHTSIGVAYEGQAGNGLTSHAGNVYLKTRF